MLSQSSYYSHDDLRLHFGLGAASRVDEIEVRWPSGKVQTVKDVDARRVVKIVRAMRGCPPRWFSAAGGKATGRRAKRVKARGGGAPRALRNAERAGVAGLAVRRRSARREIARGSCPAAPAATTDACGRHMSGAPMRRAGRWDLRGSHGPKSPRGIAARDFRLRRAAACSASRQPARPATPSHQNRLVGSS